MGYLMKSGIATHSLPDEHFILKMDGRVKSQHRRFVDALRAGLQLKDQFPHHDIKVRAAEEMEEAACTDFGERHTLRCGQTLQVVRHFGR
jgi:hypothetical protein